MRARGRAGAAFGAPLATAGRGGAALVAATAGFAAGHPATFGGAAAADSGVPQRAQNLNVGALSEAHFGHCFCSMWLVVVPA